MKNAMRGNPLKLFNCLALAAIFLTPQTGNTTQIKTIPEVLNLNTQVNYADIAGLPKDKKHVNAFNHKKHAELYLKGKAKFSSNPYVDNFTCAACHPGAANQKEILTSSPSAELKAALNKNGGPGQIKNYFHNICRSCHKKMKKAGMASGPTNCKGCHGRK